MSHWKGTWRNKEYELIENKPKKYTQYFDPFSHNIGKTDDELLRIYYFRNIQKKE